MKGQYPVQKLASAEVAISAEGISELVPKNADFTGGEGVGSIYR